MNATGWLLGGLVLATALAGCVDPAKPFGLDSTIRIVDQYRGYTWPEAAVTDAAGNLLNDTSLATDPRVGRFIHGMVAREGANPHIDFTASSVFISGFEKIHRSSDQGQNWTNVTDFRTEGFPEQQDRSYNFAAVMTVDDATDRIFLFHWTFGIPTPLGYVSYCPGLFWSQDDGHTWVPTQSDLPHMGHNPESCVSPESSYGLGVLPKMVTSPRATGGLADVPALTMEPWSRVLHVCWNIPTDKVWPVFEPRNLPYCSTSFDSGATFERTWVLEEVQREDLLDPCYIATVGRGDANSKGEVLFPVSRFTLLGEPCAPGVIRTVDNGLTWSYDVGPGGRDGTNMDIEPQIVFGEDDTAYMVYRHGRNFAPYVYWSKELFAEGSWKGPLRVSPLHHEINSHISIAAGSEGRIAVAYYGTTDWQDRSLLPDVPPWRADPNSVWHAYVTQSFNALDEQPVFVTTQVDPNQDPVQVGCMGLQRLPDAITADAECLTNLLNYVDLNFDRQGRLYLAFTDACDPRNDCIHDFSSGFQARDRNLAVAAVQGGLSMFEEKGMLEEWSWRPPYIPPRHEAPIPD